MPNKTAKNSRNKPGKSSKTEFVRPIAFLDGQAIGQLLNAVSITGASAEEMVRLKKEVKRIAFAEPTPEEQKQMAQAQAQAQQQAAAQQQQQPRQ